MTTAAPRTAPARRRPAGHRPTLAAFLGLGALVGTWAARVPDVRADLDLDEGALGAALLALSLGAVAGSWGGGLLVRRAGARRVVAAAWVVTGGALAGPALAGSWATLAGGLLALGLAMGVLDVAMNGAGVLLEAEADIPLLSGLHAGWSAGVLAGSALGTAAVALDVPVAGHLLVVGALVAAAGAAAGRRVPDGRLEAAAHHPDEPTSGRGSRTRRLAALAGIAAAVFLAEGALLDWSGVLVREDLDGGARLGALAVTAFSLGGLLGRLGGDRLAARWGPGPLLRRGVVVSAVAFAAVLASPWPAPVPLLLVVVGVGVGPSVPLAFAAAGRSHGERGIATVTTAGYGAYLAGPAMIGGLAHVADLHVALLLPLGLVVLVAALAWSVTTRP